MTNSEPSTEPSASRRALVHAWAILWRLLATLCLLEVGYAVIANTVLLTPLTRKLANGETIQLGYDWAYSPWPGHIIVKNLSLRMEDHNVQFLIGIEHGSLDVNLHELVSKRFHALHLDADNVSFRMRHKVSHVGSEGPRLAAYPPIPGFADPPLFQGPPPPPIPDSEYNLWDVRIEDVNARVKELWVLEYRYRGAGLARGSFHVRPARWYEVYPASLDLDGGKITLGSAVVAERVNAKIACRVDGSDTQALEGLEPFRKIHASLHGRFAGTDLAFLDAYLGPHAGLSATGTATVALDARLERGVLTPGTSIQIDSPDSSVGNENVRLKGATSSRLAGPGSFGEPMELGLRAERLDVEGKSARHAAPFFEHVDAKLRVSSDLVEPLQVTGGELAPLLLSVPDLGWISAGSPDLPRLAGNGRLELAATREKKGGWAGNARARVPALGFAKDQLSFAGAAKLETAWSIPPVDPGIAFERLRLDVSSSSLNIGERKAQPWSAVLTSNDLVLKKSGPTRAKGTVELHSDDARALMPLVVESPAARRIESVLLGLKRLDAKAALAVGDLTRLELLRAQAGIAKARGMVTMTRNGPTGAFLVSTGVANVGVRVDQGETRVEVLVGDGWLEKQGVRLPSR